MNRFSPLSKAGLSVALGLLFASASAPVRASFASIDRAAPTLQSFELIPAERARELPAELRAHEAAPSFAEALGLDAASGSHRVQLHWVVREGRGISGYRVTLVAADGLPGHLAARWWIPPTQGIPLGNGLTAYSAEVVLALDGQTPVTAAIEAVDSAGQATVLGVRRAVAEADTVPAAAISALLQTISLNQTTLLGSRQAPAARAATASPASYPSLPAAVVSAAPAARLSSLDPDAAASPRGPPMERVTT
jgi:hypothetical protein